ncbi:nucleoside ABC transporter membrane protein [Hydrogenoanaerobacterium saccharovorans]|uniref:Nucleoside ABC transporter membrane protein n=1 Tax=Hydrogenoanaerobacterium saccharovorans TaxID=474960 RepID=A0A1H8B4Y1_9FIRM|nr:ABC transporter permease [Hydrogenoanaerobacterium saccharovorans]RPF47590.1 nucleoside ABC transporter membrane protein [Hydrogenoanaerobacterium saccharovorans]SEM77806.1 nucleoside ABC transporter membrane protein [Hydrogenoanaerobacterium saccharovorans]
MKINNKYINLLLTIVVSMFIGAVVMLILGYNPLEAYFQLFKGAFVGKLNLGTTLQKFVPLLLTSIAFVISSRVGVFNVGVEGELYLGAMAAAWVGFAFKGLPAPIHLILCFAAAMVVGAAWAYIPGSLKARLGVNEVCVTILMNYVAKFITSYLVNGPLSAKTGVPQTPAVADGVKLTQFMKPSQAHTGLFIAIVVVVVIFWLMSRSTTGYKFTSVGLNPLHAEYVGIDPKKTMIRAMLLSGAVGGIAGAIEILGVYGYFLDNFSSGIAMDGMLAALIVKSDIKMVPLMAFFLAVLKSGALGMERYTGVPKSIVDTIIAIFIVFATMEALFVFNKRRKAKKEEQSALPGKQN